ncbi:MAG: sulfatase-like hydrolase/transferase [Flavobacteriaceae bacterium]|jgi:arylsulfatase A-like enzyme|nr:sulfatase-like hydrolase/transferase [Flavobacteriaceae bacterium]MDG2483731.1 sulfatase-like hydrolase/transferase [Flavobacteriaceae bacterium]
MNRVFYFFFIVLVAKTSLLQAQKPNILWIYAEDTSPWMGCYGDKINANATPNIDSIAAAGVRFDRAYVPAPVCSATRSALIVGQSAIRFGAHQHRSSRTQETRLFIPQDYKLLPEILIENGYTTFNHGKADYNFIWDMTKTYNYKLKKRTDFSELVHKQPFFGQIQLRGGKNNTDYLKESVRVDPNKVSVPTDYPDNEIFRKIVAQHYDAIRVDDKIIGQILQALEQTGLHQNTIVVYFSDHGANNLPRHKQMLTEGGLYVLFMVMGPDKYVPKNSVRNDLVNMLDLSATTLSWAGVDVPNWYEGQNLFSKNFTPRAFVAAHKDRLDHTIDRVRTLRTEQFRYVKNYKTDRIFLQPQYRDSKPAIRNLHHLYETNKLSKIHQQIYFGERPAEELYNVYEDPAMVFNLVDNVEYQNVLEQHRALLNQWMASGDMGSAPESIASLKANGDGKKWGEGVNPEYEIYRVDSDGDGLSDRWETANNRDPSDGLLYFEFNCGGWQTEGWKSIDIFSNLAGSLGFLDFKLDSKKGTIYKEGLQIRETNQQKSIVIKMKSNASLKIFVANDYGDLGSAEYSGNSSFEEVLIPLNKNTSLSGSTKLSISFRGKKNDLVEIDYIKQF